MMTVRIGCCITPHGLGHAARSCAVMEALALLVPVHFEIVTTVAPWFFAESLPRVSYTLHPLACDIGVIQHNALAEDLEKTVEQLDSFYPLDGQHVDRVAALFADCRLVLCDIAVLGIAAAEKAAVPSVLLENFTWDWIYQGYLAQQPAFAPHITSLQSLYRRVDFHLQTQPICCPMACDRVLGPIARVRHHSRGTVRELLQVAEDDSLVLVTMGGVGADALPLQEMIGREQVFILPAYADHRMVVRDNLRLLPASGVLYHPDLVAACDAVIGKVGYSTLAEVYQAGTPYGYIQRPKFRESAVLADFIEREMAGREISPQQFQDNSWLDQLAKICSLQGVAQKGENGASAAARFLAGLIAV